MLRRVFVRAALPVLCFLLIAAPAHAATIVWDNTSGDGLWSTCTNWVGDVCPASADTVSFDGTNDTDSVVDAAFTGTIDAFSMAAGYTGTTTIARALTLDNSGGFSQAGGKVKIESFNLSLTGNGSFSLTGGEFHGTSTTITLDRSLTVDAAALMTLSTATTTFPGSEFSDSSTLTCTGTYPGKVDITKTNQNANFTLATGCAITLANAISTLGTFTNNGTVTTGNSISLITSSGTGGSLVNNSTFNAASLTALSVEGSVTIANISDLVSFTATTTFTGSESGDVSTLTCTGTYPGKVDITKTNQNGSLTLATGCAITLANAISTFGTFTNNGTVTTGNSITLNTSSGIGGSLVNNSTFNAGSLTSLAVEGSVTIDDVTELVGFTATTTFGGSESNDDSTLTCVGTYPGTIAVTKGHALGDFTLASGCLVTLGQNTTSSGAMTISGTLDAAGYTLNPGGAVTVGSAGTLKLQGGNTTIKISTLTAGSTVDYTGSGTYTSLKATSTYSSLKFSGSGSWSTSTPLTITGNFWQTAGTFTPSATTTFSGSTAAYATTTSGSAFSHININKTSTTVTLGGNLTTTGNIALTAGGLDASAANCSSASCSVTVGGNWQGGNELFTPRTGTVTLNGTNQFITGTSTFYNLSKTVSSPDTLTFGSNQTQTVQGTWTAQGAASNLLTLTPSTPGTQWKIDPQGTRTLSYLDVSYSNNVNATAISTAGLNITDGGNTTNWQFNLDPDTPTSLGPTSLVDGSDTTDPTPSVTFSLSDSDAGNTLRYHIQIDDSSDFSSPLVDYLSPLAAQGSRSFTVGQATGGGAYTTGNANMNFTTDDTSIYWRVRSSDGTATSSYASANSGAVAFVYDSTPDGGVVGGGFIGGGSGSTPPPAPFCSLAFTPSTVTLNLPALLAWSGSGIVGGSIDNGVEAVAAAGSRIIIPPPPSIGAHLYTGFFTTDAGETVTCQATLVVTAVAKGKPSPPPQPAPIPVPAPEPAPEPIPEPTPELPPATTTPQEPPPPVEETLPPPQINDGENTTTTRDIPIDFMPSGGAESLVVFIADDLGNATAFPATATFDLCGTDIYCANGAYNLGSYFVHTDGSRSAITFSTITLADPLPLLTAAVEVLKSEETRVATQATGITVGAFGVVSTIALGGHTASEIPLLLWRSLMSLFLLGYRSRRERRWGTVYDSVTKRPLDPVIVTLYKDDGGVVGQAVTDLDGRFGFLAGGGTYYLKAEKSHHTFPAKDVPPIDLPYGAPYRGEPIVVPEGGGVIIKDVPLDPIAFDWNEVQKYKRGLYRFFSRLDRPFAYLSFVLVPIGFFASVWGFVESPTPLNLGMVAGYTAIGLLFMGGLGPRLYGLVKTTYGAPMPFARLEAKYKDSPTPAGHAVADPLGRYYLLLPPGDFTLTVAVPKQEMPSESEIVEEIPIHSRGHFNKDIIVPGP